MSADPGTAAPATVAPPEPLLDRAMAFQHAKLVMTALDTGLVALLAEGPATEELVRERLGLHARGTAHFLAALVELGVLECVDGAFANGPAVRASLLPVSPAQLGGFLRMGAGVGSPAWGRLAEGLRTGRPQAATYSGDDMFDQLYGSTELREDFVRMAEDASRPLIPALVASFDWSGVSTVLELGGCRGNVLAGIVDAHPHLHGTVLDLPQLEPAFDEHMAALGMTGRVSFRAGDFFADRLPEADVLMIGHAFVDWDEGQRRALLRATFPSVAPGGAFLIWDPVIVPGREGYLRNLVRSLNMQLMTPHGAGYTLDRCEGWLRDAGYVQVEGRELGHDVTLVVARKG